MRVRESGNREWGSGQKGDLRLLLREMGLLGKGEKKKWKFSIRGKGKSYAISAYRNNTYLHKYITYLHNKASLIKLLVLIKLLFSKGRVGGGRRGGR